MTFPVLSENRRPDISIIVCLPRFHIVRVYRIYLLPLHYSMRSFFAGPEFPAKGIGLRKNSSRRKIQEKMRTF